jgi:fructose-bisphosphate aldolase class II
MALVPTGDLVQRAWASGSGVLACNVVTLEHAEAIVAGAARAGAAVVLQISHNCVLYHGGLAPIARAALAVAADAPTEVSVHLDHATSEDLIREAVDLGLSSVMFDASALVDEQNVARTTRVVEACHRANVWVEAELGEVGGKDGVHSATARTDPQAAVAYVAATGVDARAVAVGSSHARPQRDAILDVELIARLRAAVPRPLVLHGSSGVSDAALAAAVAAGLTKINVATQLNRAFTAAVRASLAGEPAMVDPRRYLEAGRVALADEVARLLAVIATPH